MDTQVKPTALESQQTEVQEALAGSWLEQEKPWCWVKPNWKQGKGLLQVQPLFVPSPPMPGPTQGMTLQLGAGGTDQCHTLPKVFIH